MLIKRLFALFSFLFSITAVAAPTESDIALPLPEGELKGTLALPNATLKVPLVLMLSGSGPTDRNGNGPGMKNDSLKQLAHKLASGGIASVRYDKRGIAQSAGVGPAESELRLEHYVKDAVAWIAFLKHDARFSKFVILGHSEGALIGMLAANAADVDGYISVAGAGVSADVLLRNQLAGKLRPELQSENERIIASLGKGHVVAKVPADLMVLYRPSVQPYLISWFKQDPAKVFREVRAPSVVIQGSTDLQTSVESARILHQARPESALAIIPGMNHVLKMSGGGQLTQLLAYVSPIYEVSEELTRVIVSFVSKV